MPKFHVHSGSLKITIFADDPHEAALESIQWWGEGWGNDGDVHHRRQIAEQIIVTQPGGRRPAERFVTFDLLAHLHRETPTTAWRRVLDGFDPNNN